MYIIYICIYTCRERERERERYADTYAYFALLETAAGIVTVFTTASAKR